MGSLALRPDDSLAILTMALSIGFRNSVAFLSAIQATGLLTFAPVGLPPTEHASLHWTHPSASFWSEIRRGRSTDGLRFWESKMGGGFRGTTLESNHWEPELPV